MILPGPSWPAGTTVTVALLGTGIMGAGMGRNLLAAGLPLRVWNRAPGEARPLADAGAVLAADPAVPWPART